MRTEATEAKQTETATRIEPRTSAALPFIRSTELSRSRGVVAIEHKTAFKNPRRHLRQNRPKNYFAVNGKIDTTF